MTACVALRILVASGHSPVPSSESDPDGTYAGARDRAAAPPDRTVAVSRARQEEPYILPESGRRQEPQAGQGERRPVDARLIGGSIVPSPRHRCRWFPRTPP